MQRKLLLTLLCLASPLVAAADDVSGTWTGRAAVRANYYWENSTRVQAPEARLRLETPAGPRVEVNYLLDSVTSASQAQGVQSDITFTETRHDLSLGVAHELDLGGTHLDLSLRARFSREPDYLSRGLGFGAAWSFNHRLSVLRLTGYFIRDDVGRVERRADPSSGGLVQSSRVSVGDLSTLSLGLAWDQVLSPSTTLTLGLDASMLDGFQANVHRLAPSVDGPPLREDHPRTRARRANYIRLAQHISATRTTITGMYRFYRDSWKLRAHNPELRLYQQLGPYLTVRLLFRYYTQTAAYFQRDAGYTKNARYRTFDPKMEAFANRSYGFKSLLLLDFLSFTALDFAHRASLDFSFELIRSGSRYGDGVLAQGGVSWPF